MPNNLTSVATAKTIKTALTPSQRSLSTTAASAANTPFAFPRFDEFARRNPFVGAKVGAPQALATGNWAQE
ncbi:MAG TPA: hypothetical protein VFQ35_03040, partial [Polyangiaceae bacterium]|nr:hypothetical protein [Polyangiaceae bacterium]